MGIGGPAQLDPARRHPAGRMRELDLDRRDFVMSDRQPDFTAFARQLQLAFFALQNVRLRSAALEAASESTSRTSESRHSNS
jgi:hypothetical protein